MARTQGEDAQMNQSHHASEPVRDAKLNAADSKKNSAAEFLRILHIISLRTGRQMILFAKSVGHAFRVLGRRLYAFFHKHHICTRAKFRAFMRGWKESFLHPFRVMRKGFALSRQRMAQAKAEGHSSVKAFFSTWREGMRNNRRVVRTVMNYAVPAVCIVLFISIVAFTSSLTFAIEVNYNGKTLGYISDEKIYEQADNMLQQRIVSEADEEPLTSAPTFTVSVVAKDTLVDENELVDSMIQTSAKDISEAQGLYVDGQLIGAVKDKTVLTKALDSILAKYKANGATAEFVKNVELKDGLYVTSSIVEPDALVAKISGETASQKTYTVQNGDTPTGIADKFDIRYAELKKLNPNIETSLLPGQNVTISASEPYLSVKVTKKETYTESIAYKTEQVADKTYMKGYKKVTQQGQNGQKKVVANVEYINGVEVNREVLESTTLKAPVNEKVVVGTTVIISSRSSSKKGASRAPDGSRFMWPVGGTGGYTSSGFGGGRNHKGTDIAAPAGTPVYASAAGRVVLAKTYSGYGKCVIIDHGNGVQTLYGHNSALYVKPGDYVRQGENIAAVGRTGWATGNHCHFEVRINGRIVNPENYIGRKSR